jgi:hypothetical protein
MSGFSYTDHWDFSWKTAWNLNLSCNFSYYMFILYTVSPRAGGVAQVVELQALSSNSSTTKNIK